MYRSMGPDGIHLRTVGMHHCKAILFHFWKITEIREGPDDQDQILHPATGKRKMQKTIDQVASLQSLGELCNWSRWQIFLHT